MSTAMSMRFCALRAMMAAMARAVVANRSRASEECGGCAPSQQSVGGVRWVVLLPATTSLRTRTWYSCGRWPMLSPKA
eukprot:2236323-Prymnesium_polylepis.1